MNNYDTRQLNLMLQKIKEFEGEDKYLSYLITDLENLLNSLEEVDSDWKGEFRSNWLEIEIVYAIILDEERDFLNFRDQEIIKESLANIKNLIYEEKLKQAKQLQAKKGILIEGWILCPYCTIEAFEPSTEDLVIVCPNCKKGFHNPLKDTL